nr:hypothetical protein [uncultured Moraxella sp.]
MKKLSLTKFALTALLLATLVQPTFAKTTQTTNQNKQQDIWESSFAQGIQEYSVGTVNQYLLLSCDVSGGLGHDFGIYVDGHDGDAYDLSLPNVYFLFDQDPKHYTINADIGTTPKANWNAWIKKLANAKTIKLMQDNDLVLEFNPTAQSRAKYSKKLVKECNATNSVKDKSLYQ